MSNKEPSDDDDYQDDKTIGNETVLYRRVMSQPDPPVKQIVWNANEGCWRPSTAAFQDHPDGKAMSVGLGDTLDEKGLLPSSLLDGHDKFSLVSFPASLPREKNLSIVRRALDDDPAHGEVFGKKTKGVKRAFAKNSVWTIPPDIPDPE